MEAVAVDSLPSYLSPVKMTIICKDKKVPFGGEVFEFNEVRKIFNQEDQDMDERRSSSSSIIDANRKVKVKVDRNMILNTNLDSNTKSETSENHKGSSVKDVIRKIEDMKTPIKKKKKRSIFNLILSQQQHTKNKKTPKNNHKINTKNPKIHI